MTDPGSGVGEDLDLGRIEVNPVREDHIAAGQTHRVEVLDVAHPGGGANGGDLVGVLGGVGVEQPAVFTREASAALEQPPGARQGEAWRHRVAEAATGSTVPAPADGLGVGERGVGVFHEGRRRVAPHIHVGPAGCHSNPHAFGGFENAVVVMGRPEIENRRRSTGEKLGDAEFGGGCDPVAVEGRFVGQGSLFEPVEELPCRPPDDGAEIGRRGHDTGRNPGARRPRKRRGPAGR